jgi:sortase A
MNEHRHSRPGLELALFGAGFVLLGIWTESTLSARAYQNQAANVVDQWSTSAPTETAAYPSRVQAIRRGLVGRLEIPRVGLSVIVAEGTDENTLERAVGHVSGTALPGEPGNVGLVGHRDTYFRTLERVRPGDTIRLTGPDGRHTYRVGDVDVVSPRQVDVLDPTPTPSLTLVTCYPFHAVGPAPRRFVVRAVAIKEPSSVPVAAGLPGTAGPLTARTR